MDKLSDVGDFWKIIVVPDVGQYLNDPANLRKAMHVAVSLYHVRDWGAKTGLWADDNTPFYNLCPEFRFIRDVCNALKHLKLDRPKTKMSDAMAVQQRGIFDSGIFDSGIFDTARVVVDAGADGVHDFKRLVLAVERMWRDVLTSKGVL